MNHEGEPYVIEYNARMGDPETEVVLPRIESDFLSLLIASSNGTLSEQVLQISSQYAVTTMVVAGGYPETYRKGDVISNLDVMLSMDSGNAHIAAMLGVKVITLWGATHPFTGFSPFNQPFENALTADRNLFPKLPTSVYGNKKVEGYEEAMRTISVQSTIDKINSSI